MSQQFLPSMTSHPMILTACSAEKRWFLGQTWQRPLLQMRKSRQTGMVTMSGPQLKISCLMFSVSEDTQQSPITYFWQDLVRSTHCSSVSSLLESYSAHFASTKPQILPKSSVRDTNPPLQLELMTLSQNTGVWAERLGYSSSFERHQRSVMALMEAMEQEEEQLPWVRTGRAQLGYCSRKLQDSGTMVSLLPVLHLQSCCLLEACTLMVRFASTSLYPSNMGVGPTVKVRPAELMEAMYSGSLTSVLCTSGPDFHSEFTTAISTSRMSTPNTMWQEYLSSRSSFFRERSAWALRARSRASGSTSVDSAPSFLGDLDLAIDLIIKARVMLADFNIPFQTVTKNGTSVKNKMAPLLCFVSTAALKGFGDMDGREKALF